MAVQDGLGCKTGVFADQASAGEEQWPPPPPPPMATGVFAETAFAWAGAGDSSPGSNGVVEIVSERSSDGYNAREQLECRRSAAPDMEVVDLCGD